MCNYVGPVDRIILRLWKDIRQIPNAERRLEVSVMISVYDERYMSIVLDVWPYWFVPIETSGVLGFS